MTNYCVNLVTKAHWNNGIILRRGITRATMLNPRQLHAMFMGECPGDSLMLVMWRQLALRRRITISTASIWGWWQAMFTRLTTRWCTIALWWTTLIISLILWWSLTWWSFDLMSSSIRPGLIQTTRCTRHSVDLTTFFVRSFRPPCRFRAPCSKSFMASSTSDIVADDVTGFLQVASGEINRTQDQLANIIPSQHKHLKHKHQLILFLTLNPRWFSQDWTKEVHRHWYGVKAFVHSNIQTINSVHAVQHRQHQSNGTIIQQFS